MRRFADSMAWAGEGGFAIDAAVDERMAFIRRTYVHLLIMLCGVAAAAAATVRLGIGLNIAIPGGFIGLIALMILLPRWLSQRAPKSKQYLAATLCVVFYGVLLAPLAMYVQLRFGSYAILGQAFGLTACVFGGLTAYVFITRKDFSFLGAALWMGLMVAIGASVITFFFGGFGGGFQTILSLGVVLLFCGFVLYDTSNILHHYGVGDHVIGATMLLIDFVVLFKYIAFLLISLRD